MLCDRCHAIFEGDPLYDQWRGHHKSIANLYDAVQQKCYICERMWKSLVKEYGYNRDGIDGTKYDTIPYDEQESLMLQYIHKTPGLFGSTRRYRSSMSFFVYKLKPHTRGERWLEFKTRTEIDTERSESDDRNGFVMRWFRLTLSLQKDFDDSRAFRSLQTHERSGYPIQLAKYWLNHCTKHHLNCVESSSSWLPTRLLHIANSDPIKIQLVDTKKAQLRCRYVTLSHCWGTGNFFKHTSENSSELFSGIEFSCLPRTFRNAVYTTLQLGEHYLWIDSLCIIQGDQDDWLRESSVMGQVYQNGYCNLAATQSASADNGFLTQEFPWTKPEQSLYVRAHWDNEPQSYWLLHKGGRSSGTLAGPLLTRGWVVQERLLARRVLHFASDQLYWECGEYDACESFPQGIPPDSLSPWGMPEPEIKRRHKRPGVSMSSREAINFWVELVNLFSTCRLTMEQDKLVALSGIAKIIQGSFPDSQYFAGMWRHDLESQLLWRTIPRTTPTKPQKYRAPSWSWASVDGDILRFFGNPANYTTHIEVLEANTTPLGDDPMGQVANGFIKIMGPLITISLSRRLGGEPLFDDCDARINGRWHNQHMVSPDITNEEIPAIERLHCLIFRSSTRDVEDGDGESHWKETDFEGLLLQPTKGNRGTFERRGRISSIKLEDYGVDLVDFVLVWSEIANEEWLEYESGKPGKSVITIV